MSSGLCSTCRRTLTTQNFETCAACGRIVCERCAGEGRSYQSPVDGLVYCDRCVDSPADVIAEVVAVKAFDRAREWVRQNDMSDYDIRNAEDELSLVWRG